jgi:Listeria-Bacteroides repeat domain (List_Bact_rpt)
MKRLPYVVAFSFCMLLLCCKSPTGQSTYNVKYDPNGAAAGVVPTDSASYKEGATVTVLSNTGNLSLSGYSTSGWNTKADGSGVQYAYGASFTIGSADVVLYATWSKVSASTSPPLTWDSASWDSVIWG